MQCEIPGRQQHRNRSQPVLCACPLGCASADRTLHQFGEFRINRCEACGLVRLNPRLPETDLPTFYDNGYFSGEHLTGYDSYEADAELYEKTFAHRLKLIRRFKKGGKLLDIGCGLGYFLNVAQRAGFDVYGLDVSAYAVDRCRDLFPGRIKAGVLAPNLFPAKTFDVITMFDLFEHVYNPRAFLSLLSSIASDDGIVVITTPNHRSLLSRLSGRKWISYKIPEHVYYYTPDTLRRMAAPDFKIDYLRSEGQYCSLEFLAERLKSLSPVVGRMLLSTVRATRMQRLPIYVNSGSMTAVLKVKL
jgi:cyclopropane fatty-acyl-phospholipid synthase-like methyltransferase